MLVANPVIPKTTTPRRRKNSAPASFVLNSINIIISTEANAMPNPMTLLNIALLVDSTISPLPVTITDIPANRKTAHIAYPKIRICLNSSDNTSPAKMAAAG